MKAKQKLHTKKKKVNDEEISPPGSYRSTFQLKYIFFALLTFIIILITYEAKLWMIKPGNYQSFRKAVKEIKHLREPNLNSFVHPSSSPTITPIPQLKEQPSYAYTTLIHGIDDSYQYRGFLFNAIISHKKLASFGSTADFVVMVGFSNNYFSAQRHMFESDFKLLEEQGIKLHFLDRLLENPSDSKEKVTFAEMALLKITPWSMKQYKKIQYIDGDVMINKNMDCYFQLNINSWNTGNASPLNSGWFLALPDNTAFEEMRALALQRLSYAWDETLGWGSTLPDGIFFRGKKQSGKKSKEVRKWDFNGASLDQGLFLYEFLLNTGNIMLLDEESARIAKAGEGYNGLPDLLSLDQVLACCDAELPTSKFFHFTGKSKPWLQEDLSHPKSEGLRVWAEELDKLGIPGINSQSLAQLNLKPPLGYFYPNK